MPPRRQTLITREGKQAWILVLLTKFIGICSHLSIKCCKRCICPLLNQSFVDKKNGCKRCISDDKDVTSDGADFVKFQLREYSLASAAAEITASFTHTLCLPVDRTERRREGADNSTIHSNFVRRPGIHTGFNLLYLESFVFLWTIVLLCIREI